MTLLTRLAKYEEKHGKAAVAIVGAGYVANGVTHSLGNTPGMYPALIVNRTIERAVENFLQLGFNRSDIVVSDMESELVQALEKGKPAVTSNADLIPHLPIKVLIEATGSIDHGTEVILSALKAGIHVVSFNAEVDALLGWTFHQHAKENKVVYTISDGDQPGVLLRLGRDVATMGFEISAYINCKRHLNLYQNPSSSQEYEKRDSTSARMTTSFGDGTKMQVEQAVVANATGFVPTKLGMSGISTSVENAAIDIGQMLEERSESISGYVDYTLGGDFGAGVAVLATHPQVQHHKKALGLYKMGEGPNYFFFKPYHLVHLELPFTVADILLHEEALATVVEPHAVEVIAMSKKELDKSEMLDGIGGFTCYGLIEKRLDATDYLPISLSQYAMTKNQVPKDKPIKLSDVDLDSSIGVVKEWMKQCSKWSQC